MKISDAIKILQDIKKKHGDLPIWITHEWTSEFLQGDYSGIHYRDEYISPTFSQDKFPERVEFVA